jgi:hypothetical protein
VQQETLHIRGTRNIVASAIHIHLFPQSTEGARIERPRAWLACGLAASCGAFIARCDASIATLAVAAVSFIAMLLILQGGKDDERREQIDQSATGRHLSNGHRRRGVRRR